MKIENLLCNKCKKEFNYTKNRAKSGKWGVWRLIGEESLALSSIIDKNQEFNRWIIDHENRGDYLHKKEIIQKTKQINKLYKEIAGLMLDRW